MFKRMPLNSAIMRMGHKSMIILIQFCDSETQLNKNPIKIRTPIKSIIGGGYQGTERSSNLIISGGAKIFNPSGLTQEPTILVICSTRAESLLVHSSISTVWNVQI